MQAAVIGTGFIGPVHVEALRRAGIPVVGILGSSIAKSQQTATELNVPRAYANLAELLDDSEIQSVHITSPNQAHFEQARRCIEAGKHVLCEKPLAMNSHQSRQLVELARDSGVAAGVNYNIRYYPLCVEAAEQHKAGELGRVNHIAGSYTQDWLFHPTDFNWRVLADAAGPLRAVADIGTHWLDLIFSITGLDVTSVCADLQIVHPIRWKQNGSTETFTAGSARESQPPADSQSIAVDTEDNGSVLLRFKGGARGVFWVSQVTAGRKNCLRWEIAGAQKSLSWDSESPNQMWVGHRDSANGLVTRDPALLRENASRRCSYPGGHNEGFSETFKQLFLDFYRNIESGQFRNNPSYPTFADGHREIVLCEAILRSAQEQRWVEIDS